MVVTVISVITRLCWVDIESLKLSQLSSQQWTLDSHKLVYHVQLSYNPEYSSGTIVASIPGSTQTRQFSPTFAFTSRRAPKTQSHALVSCSSNFLCSNPRFFKLLVFKSQLFSNFLCSNLRLSLCTSGLPFPLDSAPS